MSPQITPGQKYFDDTGLRGSPVMTYGQVIGNRVDTYDCKGNVYADTFPHLLLGTLGGPDTKTGSGPYLHTIPLLNSASTGSQPPSYTITDYDGTDHARQMAGSQIATLTLDFAADQPFSYTAKYFGDPFTNASVIPSPTFTGEVFIPGWNASVSLAGSVNAKMESGEIVIDRSTNAIFTMGTTGPYVIWTGPIKVSGKFVIVYEANDPSITYGTTVDPLVAQWIFADTVAGHTVTLKCSATQIMEPKYTRGKNYVEAEMNFTANGDTTDAVLGYSPITTAVSNGISTTY